MTASWNLTLDSDRIAWLACDTPGTSTNVLSAAVVRELSAVLTELEGSRPAALILHSGKSNGFFAGADIQEFLHITTPEEGYERVRAGQAVLDQLDVLPCPTIAALHGFVLGGGLELALACDYRVGAGDGLSLGLPEILLGIHPGLGGTVRSVQLLGARAALDLMLRGKTVKGGRALELGLLDRLVGRSELLRCAGDLARQPPPRHRPSLTDRLLNLGPLRGLVAGRIAAELRRKVPILHYPAPYALLDLWRRHGASPATGYDAEARSIGTLLCTATSRNLVRVFLLQDRLKDLGKQSTAPQCSHLHVIGAGVMGGDIAAWAALRGMTVTLQDPSEDLLAPAFERARVLFSKRLTDPEAAAEALARMSRDVDGAGVASADVVIEAIVENADTKRALIADIEPRLKPSALLATNTSSIQIETLAKVMTDPKRLVGIHFFNPVAQMQLVEIVAGEDSAQLVLEGAMAFTRRLDKLPLPCRSAPGFVVNRILTPYLNEAIFALESGVAAAAIDRAGTDFGMPMGPIELADVVGLDVCLLVGRVLGEAYGRRAPAILIERVEQQKLGRKTGEGFYVWRDGKPVRGDSSPIVADDLEDRLILPLLNEAVAVLREQVVADADLLDAGIIFATGFAPFRGGPLQYARSRGIGSIVHRLREFEEIYGERFRPDAGWDLLHP